MSILKTILVMVALAVPLTAFNATVFAATAHNSQAGGFGASSNATDTTVSSRHVKHADKHRMR